MDLQNELHYGAVIPCRLFKIAPGVRKAEVFDWIPSMLVIARRQKTFPWLCTIEQIWRIPLGTIPEIAVGGKNVHDVGRYAVRADSDHGGRTRRPPLSSHRLAAQTCRPFWWGIPDRRLRAFKLPQFGSG